MRLGRTVLWLWTAAALYAPLLAQHDGGRDGGGMEEFEEVDPYTNGERELMNKLGYSAFGPFHWRGPDFTNHIQESVGSVPMIWVETEHFKIGSSLGTYEIPNDREEKERIKAELKRLKKRLGRLKPPRNELDPWLRLHLYAQRAENLYAMFVQDFGIEPSDFDETHPYLGNENKFQILLCQRKSEFARFVTTYIQQQNDDAFRWGWYQDCMFLGAAIEAMEERWVDPQEQPFDSMLHCRIAGLLTANFIDGYKHQFGAPRWLGYALGHVYVRRIDPRWMTAAGHTEDQARQEDDWLWEPRVYGLVKNEFFDSTEEMFQWSGYEAMDTRDHMIAWSKVDYLLTEAGGDLKGWLQTLTSIPRRAGEDPEARVVELAELQRKALLAYFELTPEQLDENWSKWVKKTYEKK